MLPAAGVFLDCPMKTKPSVVMHPIYPSTASPGITSRWKSPLRLLLLSAGTVITTAFSQHDYTFDHLGVKQGLSQGTVYCCFQDSRGFMWLGTQDGLNRFDGYDFQIFKHDATDPGSLNDNFVISIAETPDGTLWVQTLNYQDFWNRFDRLSETFSQVPKDSVNTAGCPISSVFRSYEDPNGMRWTGKIGGGVTRFDPRTKETTVFKHTPADPGSLIDDRVYSVVGDRAGRIWIATREGLDRYDPSSGIFKHYRNDSRNPSSLSDNWVWPILEDNTGTIWVGSFRNGLNKYEPKTDSFIRFFHNEADSRSLNDNAIKSLYQDRSGVIWVGVGDVGVDRFHPEMSFFKHYVHDPKVPTSLINNNVFGMYVDRSGTAWIGTRGGLDRLDGATGKFTHYTHNPANPRSIGDNSIFWFLEDRDGILWLATESNGLDRFDRGTGVFTHYRHDPANPGSITDNRVYYLLEDRTGAFWVATYGGGLNLFDRARGTFTAFTHNDSDSTSLGAQGVWALCEDREGNLWVGTYGGGVDRFDRDSRSFTHYKHSDANPKSLSNNTVYCLHEDRSGSLWVGTQAGLNRLDRSTGTFKRYGLKEGLPNDVISGILEDRHGFLWISTNKGICRLNPSDGTVRNFDLSDGLQGNEFNQFAFTMDRQTGEMYFGGSNGFNMFHPDSIRTNTFVPPVVFSSFARYNTDDEEGRALDVPGIAARQSITLSYKDNIANIEFAALNFYNTAKNQYTYKLEGFSDNWIQLGTERRATFTNLDAGEYVLRVRGSNNDGVWNTEGAALQLTVTPPWWKTRWAYGTYAVLVLAFLYGIRTAELKRREQKGADPRITAPCQGG